MRMSLGVYRRIPFWILPLVAGIILAALPLFGAPAATLRLVVSIALMALLVLGLNITFGYAGELALGQSALYAIGAYFAGYFAIQGLDLSLTLVIGILVAALVGLLTGIPGLRLGSWSMAMVTFFLVLLVPNVVTLLTPLTGGASGMTGIPIPELFGRRLDDSAYYMLVIVVAMTFFALLRNYIVSPNGNTLGVIKASPVLARSLGLSVTRTKLTAYLLGALPAGAAGALFAYQDGYISPGTFGLTTAITILAATIIGGSMSIYGAVIGAAILVLGPLRASGTQQFSLLLFGVLLLVGGLFFGGGIAGFLKKAQRRFLIKPEVLPDAAAATVTEDTIQRLKGGGLVVDSLSMEFGGNVALDNVSLGFAAGDVTALIGPNGSGKTTLLNVASGFYRPTSGAVRLDDLELSKLAPHQVGRQGVTRTFQTPIIPEDMTVVEVVMIAMHATDGPMLVTSILRLPGYRPRLQRHRKKALELLALLGIADLADVDASSLPLGTRRLLEVARSLAASPKMVLLDEPASGLDEAEVDNLAKVIRRLRDTGASIVLVEHNFEMVMSVADRVHVLDRGRVIASGEPYEVRNDPSVVAVYLGKAVAEAERTNPAEAKS